MINLYLGREEGTKISSLIKSADGNALLDGYAREALSVLFLLSLINTKFIRSFIQDLTHHSRVYIVRDMVKFRSF